MPVFALSGRPMTVGLSFIEAARANGFSIEKNVDVAIAASTGDDATARMLTSRMLTSPMPTGRMLTSG